MPSAIAHTAYCDSSLEIFMQYLKFIFRRLRITAIALFVVSCAALRIRQKHIIVL